jgi:hypothetical protein
MKVQKTFLMKLMGTVQSDCKQSRHRSSGRRLSSSPCSNFSWLWTRLNMFKIVSIDYGNVGVLE